MKRMLRYTICTTVVFACLLQTAEARYTVKVVNHFNEPAGITMPVDENGTVDTHGVNYGGNFFIRVPYHGVVALTDRGHNNVPCEYPHWAVRIQYMDKLWNFYYDGDGAITITINSDGSITPTGNGQVIEGDSPPRCK